MIQVIYSLYETDDDGWDSTSPEYITARAFINAGLHDWEMRQEWRDLWSTLTAASDGTKTLTAGTYSYVTPTNFVRLGSWVRTVNNGVSTFWEVKTPEMVAKLAGETGKFVYITGSVKSGFYLNFNPKETLTTGDTINYEYYITPTEYTATSSVSEIPDPYYCIYYALARLLKNDGEDFSYEEGIKRDIMDSMITNNMSGVWDVSNAIEEPLNMGAGFGI